MNYSGLELASVVKVAIDMAAVDGFFADEERVLITNELSKFGVDPLQAAQLLIRARDMKPSEAISIIGKMNSEQKKYVSGFLAAIMVSDGNIAESEVKLWTLVSLFASLPDMDVAEALEFWNTH